MRLPTTLLLALGALALSGCSVSITADGTAGSSSPLDPSAAASAAASQAAVDSQDYVTFCGLEAKGSLDFLSVLGDGAGDAIKDGISQSISQQGLTGKDAEACTQAWVDTLKGYGLTYDPVANTISGTLTVPDSASPAAS